MTALEHIETQVQKLNLADFTKFRKWFDEYKWQAWDQQIAQDFRSGHFYRSA